MALISEADAIQILGDRIHDLREVMVAAWNDYCGYAPAHRRVHCPTTRAGIVHDHIKSRARERFGGDASSHVLEFNKLLVVVIDQRLTVRFKLFHRDKSSSNIPTRQVEDYRMQRDLAGLREQLNLIGELSNLEAGYILDQLDSEIRETWLVCPSGIRANAWVHEIKDKVTTAGQQPSSVSPLSPSSTTTVRPKEKVVVTINRTEAGREPS